MLPILIVPEHQCEPAQLRHIDASYLDPYAKKPKKWVRPRRAGMRVRMRLAPVIEIRHKVPLGVHDNKSAPGSLQDCDQLLKVLLRRKMVSLGRRERGEIGRVLQAARPVTVSACTLSGGAATWLLWAMSWRGVSTPRQLSSPPLHAPTLILSWWASMPGPLCFGPAGTLFQALADCAASLYRFWGRVVERMRAAGWYLLDPRLVRIKFKPLQADANGIYPKGQFGHSEDFGGIGPS